MNTKMRKHIVTLEDPIEYLHKHGNSIIDQREIGLDTNNFANGLRAALRQDPDVILVGELRDLDTIQTAITAAETGHLVLGTLHTSSAPATINRIIDVFPPGQQAQIRIQLASVLVSVISQRLFPTVDKKRAQKRNGNSDKQCGCSEPDQERKNPSNYQYHADFQDPWDAYSRDGH